MLRVLRTRTKLSSFEIWIRKNVFLELDIVSARCSGFLDK